MNDLGEERGLGRGLERKAAPINHRYERVPIQHEEDWLKSRSMRKSGAMDVLWSREFLIALARFLAPVTIANSAGARSRCFGLGLKERIVVRRRDDDDGLAR